MKFRTLAAFALLAITLALPAQEDGYWRAISNTARSITGDVSLGQNKLVMNFLAFPIAEIRPLTRDELLAVFNPDDPAHAVGHLYKMEIGSDRKFNHKNTLCGSDTVEYMATAVIGRELHIAMFSTKAIPTLTMDFINNSTDVCGTYTYTR